jgi:putative transposase
LVCHVQAKLGVSERRACNALGHPRSTQRYMPRVRDSECELTAKIHELAGKHSRYGYRRIHAKLCREGWRVNRKRVHRIWRAEGLKVIQKQRKRRRVGTKDGSCARQRAEHPNHVWAIDFVFDQTANWRSLKILAVTDEYTRECLDLPADRHFTHTDVIDVLAKRIVERGAPKHIRADNGPEFIAGPIRSWLSKLDVGTLFIEPGAPWQNAYVESFNGKLRDELLDRELITDLSEARYLLNNYRDEYNHDRPHMSLGYMTPVEFAASRSNQLGPTALAGSIEVQPDNLALIGVGT